MKENNTKAKNQFLFASITLPNGKEVKIYGFMPALELKQLAERCQALVTDDPTVPIPDVYNRPIH